MKQKYVDEAFSLPLFVFGESEFLDKKYVDVASANGDVVTKISESEANYVIKLSEILQEALYYIANTNEQKYKELLNLWNSK